MVGCSERHGRASVACRTLIAAPLELLTFDHIIPHFAGFGNVAFLGGVACEILQIQRPDMQGYRWGQTPLRGLTPTHPSVRVEPG